MGLWRWDSSGRNENYPPQLKNPVHKYAKNGYYISCLTIKCTGYNGKLWFIKLLLLNKFENVISRLDYKLT